MFQLDNTKPQSTRPVTPDDAAITIPVSGPSNASTPPEAPGQDYFSSVVQSMSDSLVVIGANGRIAAVNPATLQLLGYEEDELVGQLPDILFADGTVRGNGLETLHRRGIVQKGEKTLRAKDGRHIPVFYSGSVLRNPQGEIKGIVCVAHDATKQKQLEQGLRDALQKEQELLQLKSQFVRTVSHEFRTPLAIILNNSELLHLHRDRMDAEQKEAHFDAVKRQVKHMTRLLEGALTLEKMQAGSLPFQPSHVAMDGLCRGLVDAVRGRVNRDFVYTCQGDKRDIMADETLVKQVVTHLLSNAIKFSTPDSQVTLTLSHATDHVTLAIQDQGIGIPEVDQAHLFEPFFRGPDIGVVAGTGLGLALTQQAVALHGGTIAVDSQVGTGTTVTVTLPVQPDTNRSRNGIAPGVERQTKGARSR